MKVKEARETYSFQLKQYNMKKFEISKQKESLEKQMTINPGKKDELQKKLDTLQVNYDAISEKYDEYKTYMEKVMTQWQTKFDEINTKQQTEAAEKYGEDMAKLMTVARRMMNGDTVPSSDEKRLMEYNKEIYQMAKNMQMMAQLEKKKHKAHKSLWEDEEQTENVDPTEAADDQDLSVGPGPKVVDVDTTIANAGGEIDVEI